MAEDDVNATEHRDEEISLVDILAVLLKHWKWLTAVLAGTLVLAAVGYFLYPSWKEAQIKKDSLSEASITLSLSPLVLNAMPDAADRVVFSLRDPVLLYQALKNAGFQSYMKVSLTDPTTEAEALLTIRSYLVDNKDLQEKALRPENQVFFVAKEGPTVRVNFRNRDEGKALAFLAALVPLATDSLKSTLFPVMQNQVDGFEKFLGYKVTTLVTVSELISGFTSYNGAKILLSGREPAIAVQQPAYILARIIPHSEIVADYMKKAILALVGIMFVALVGAFLIEAVEGIRRDPAAMAKLRAATKRG